MKIGVEGLKMPEARKRGALASLDHAKSYGMEGIFFSTVLDMSPTLDAGALSDIRARADELDMYLEAGLGKINPYASPEAPELRAIGDGDIVFGFRRMMEASAAIGCRELWIATGNFKAQFRGRLANDRFRTDVTWTEQLAAMERLLLTLAPIARDLGIHMNMETHDEITSFEILRLLRRSSSPARRCPRAAPSGRGARTRPKAERRVARPSAQREARPALSPKRDAPRERARSTAWPERRRVQDLSTHALPPNLER